MDVRIARTPVLNPACPARPLAPARLVAFDDAYTLFVRGTPRWQVAISWGTDAQVPFREEIIWPSAGVVAIGGGAAVYFVDLASGSLRPRLAVNTRRVREAADWTQEAVADRCDIDVRMLQRIEAGELNVSLETVERLALGLDVDPTVLLQPAPPLARRRPGRPRRTG